MPRPDCGLLPALQGDGDILRCYVYHPFIHRHVSGAVILNGGGELRPADGRDRQWSLDLKP
jgi:hypothetical protein